MQRDSFVFYRSFRESIKHLPEENKHNAITFILEYGLEGKHPDAKKDKIAFAIFLMAKPNIDANNEKYKNGKKGGRPETAKTKDKLGYGNEKPKHNQTETKPKPKHNQSITKPKPNEDEDVDVNENENDNENYNDNDNEKENNIIHKEFYDVSEFSEMSKENNILPKGSIEQSSEIPQNISSYKSIQELMIKKKSEILEKKKKQVMQIESGTVNPPPPSNFGNSEINELIEEIKKFVESEGYIYKAGRYERGRAKNMLTSKEIGNIVEKHNITRQKFIIGIIKLSNTIEFWRGKIYNCETRYKHYPKVYNDYINEKNKNQKIGYIY